MALHSPLQCESAELRSVTSSVHCRGRRKAARPRGSGALQDVDKIDQRYDAILSRVDSNRLSGRLSTTQVSDV